MSADLWVDIGSNIIMLCVAAYAIRDTREQARQAILSERNRVYSNVRADMAWLYIEPTDSAQSPEIAKQLEEFCNLAREADPQWTIEDLKEAVEKESLHFADTLVRSGYATWKKEFSPTKVAKTLQEWQADKNSERIKNLMAGKERLFLL